MNKIIKGVGNVFKEKRARLGACTRDLTAKYMQEVSMKWQQPAEVQELGGIKGLHNFACSLRWEQVHMTHIDLLGDGKILARSRGIDQHTRDVKT